MQDFLLGKTFIHPSLDRKCPKFKHILLTIITPDKRRRQAQKSGPF